VFAHKPMATFASRSARAAPKDRTRVWPAEYRAPMTGTWAVKNQLECALKQKKNQPYLFGLLGEAKRILGEYIAGK
jgi:hypothetical protein